MHDISEFKFEQIGVINTPFQDHAPYQPVDTEDGEFCLSVFPPFLEGLKELDQFRYIYVLYFAHRITQKPEMMISPPWAKHKKVGLFSSRSPNRPNPIGLSVVSIKKITETRIYTSGLDVFDGTPLLDIKPYIKDLDTKADANYGWVEGEGDMDHLMLHIKGIPHDY